MVILTCQFEVFYIDRIISTCICKTVINQLCTLRGRPPGRSLWSLSECSVQCNVSLSGDISTDINVIQVHGISKREMCNLGGRQRDRTGVKRTHAAVAIGHVGQTPTVQTCTVHVYF